MASASSASDPPGRPRAPVVGQDAGDARGAHAPAPVLWGGGRRVLVASLVHGLVLAAGLLMFTWGRYQMNPDGMSYLDMSDGVPRGEPWRLVNEVWSPLYPLVLGMVTPLLRGWLGDEFEALHLVNLGIYLFAWLAVLHLGRTCCRDESGGTAGRQASAWLPLVVAGAFLSNFAAHMRVTLVTPDGLLVGLLAMSLAEAARVLCGEDRRFVPLGAWLGLACLAKAIAMPFSLFVGLLIGIRRGLRGPHLSSLAAGALVFALLLAAWVVPMSRRAGHLTLGASGYLNRAWLIVGVSPYRYWRGEPPGTGHPEHPPRLVTDQPAVYYFGDVFDVTYPLWFDPAYWHKGLDASPTLAQTARSAGAHLGTLGGLVFGRGLAVLPISAALVLLFRRTRDGAREPLPAALLLVLPAVACMLLYALVSVLGRYVAPLWIPAVTVTVATALRSGGRDGWSRGLLVGASALVLAVSLYPKVGLWIEGQPFRNESRWEAAQLHTAGVAFGARVAVLDNDHQAYWARVGRYRIVADIAASLADYCAASPDVGTRIRAELAARGVVAIVGRRQRGQDPCGGAVGVEGTALLVWHLSPS